MDSGPFSTPQPQDRRATSSRPPEPPHRTAPHPAEEPVRTVRRAPMHREPEYEQKSGFKKFILPLLIGLVVIALGISTWLVMSRQQDSLNSVINKNEYQAVFFTNGQVYFGKLSVLNDNYLKLTDIYYLQTKSTDESSKLQETSNANSNDVQLIKLGSEIHGPQDQMAISRSQVLFVENIKPDGKVAQAIQQNQSKQ